MTGPKAAVRIAAMVCAAAVTVAALALHATGVLWLLLLVFVLGVFS